MYLWRLKPKLTFFYTQGIVENVGEMQVYRVGESSKCIVWNYHIMGFNGGRARQLVDMIASKGKRRPILFTTVHCTKIL